MRFLATYIMRGRAQAMVVAAVSAALALLLMPLGWPLSWISAAAIGLVTLIQGPFEGLLATLGAAVLVGLLVFLSFGTPAPAFVFVLAAWLPAWLLTHFVRQSGALSLGLLAGAGLGLVLVLGAFVVLGDPAQAWHQYVNQVMLPALQQAGLDSASREQIKSELGRAAPILTGMLAAIVTLGWLVALMLARWWQAQLVRPEGFRREFHALRLGRSAALVGVLVAAAGALPGTVGTVAINLAWVVAVLFLMQGLAVVHALLAGQRSAAGWLVGLYGLLLIVPYSILLMAATGIADNWADFRRRVRAPRQ